RNQGKEGRAEQIPPDGVETHRRSPGKEGQAGEVPEAGEGPEKPGRAPRKGSTGQFPARTGGGGAGARVGPGEVAQRAGHGEGSQGSTQGCRGDVPRVRGQSEYHSGSAAPGRSRLSADGRTSGRAGRARQRREELSPVAETVR